MLPARCRRALSWNAACRAVLLSALLMSGCAGVTLPAAEAPLSGPDPGYGKTVGKQLKTAFKNLTPYDSVEISELRWVHSLKGWSWLACVHFQDRGHRRTYAIFFTGNTVVDARYAVQADACDVTHYAPFDPETGAIGPGAVHDQNPLY
jgi:hypothetical protein